MSGAAPERVLQRLAVPARADRSALYLDGGEARDGAVHVPAGTTASLGTYFNSFPAAYWSAWTSVHRVILVVSSSGGGRLTVLTSDAAGIVSEVRRVDLPSDGETMIELSLDGFEDGGLLWADVTTDGTDVIVRATDWLGDDAVRTATATIAITTLDRPEFTIALLRTLSGSEPLRAVVPHILVVDQGRTPLESSPEAAALLAADPRLRILRQANAGGSGGFSRGMLQALDAGTDTVLLLDDDVEVDPESIRRSLAFTSRTVRPTIVGAQMLDLRAPTVLHSGAETVIRSNFMWRSLTPSRHDFAATPLRRAAAFHRRWDAGYNGWWMCLIPTSVLASVGLSLPFFIKWDDAEYGLRAAAAGVPTVTLPGAGIWHVAWVDKNDAVDWQAFYHARNRLVAALLHSGTRHGGTLVLRNFALDVRYLLTADYSAVALRQEAYRSALAPPETLGSELTSRLPQLRRLRSRFADATSVERLPDGVTRLHRTGGAPSAAGAAVVALRRLARHALIPARPGNPVAIGAADARWWATSGFDAVYVEAADRSSFALHRRSVRRFWRGLVPSTALAIRVWMQWPGVAERYRRALPELTSPESWRRWLGVDSPTT